MTVVTDLSAFRRTVARLGAELVQLGLLDGPEQPVDVLPLPRTAGARPEPLTGQLSGNGAKAQPRVLQFTKRS